MFRVLNAIERGMIHSQYADVDQIASYAAMNMKKCEYNLRQLHKMDLIHRWVGHFTGYELTINGYDALALNALFESEQVYAIGLAKGTGKESILYFVQTPEGEERIIKLHRVGYTSFQQVRKKRTYTANKKHMSSLYASRLSAEAEYKTLIEMNRHQLPVPKVFGINRHVILMEYIDGYDLTNVQTIDDPTYVLDQLLDFIDNLWHIGYIHGDLSEYNVILSADAKITVIDFPQTIDISHENAEEYLERDVHNILHYFKRKYKIERALTEVLAKITEKNR